MKIMTKREIVDDNDEPGGGYCNVSLEHVYLYLHYFDHVRILN